MCSVFPSLRTSECYDEERGFVPKKRSGKMIRCGDVVLHKPTGEEWTVAFADHERGKLSACGWPAEIVPLADCDLVRACSDEEHTDLVEQFRKSSGGDFRRGEVLRLYASEKRDEVNDG